MQTQNTIIYNDPIHDRYADFYSPHEQLQNWPGEMNQAILRALETIRPVAMDTDMLQVLEIFRGHQQEHFFPVLDPRGAPLGLIRERSLKSYVYSRFGMALLANRGQSRQLESFLSDCPCVEVNTGIDQVLQAAHRTPGSEGVLITAGGCYVGFIRASSLVEMAHEQQLEIVRRHNSELDQKSREIQAVLRNMRQGICTILPDLRLHADFSVHLANILEHDHLAGAHLRDVLLAHSELGPDALQQIEAALMAIIEQDAFMFDCNAHLLPTEMAVNLNGRVKILELHWNPMLNEQDEVSRLMLVVRDISQMRQLQQMAEQQAHELQLLGEILAAGEARFTPFMDHSTAQLQSCQRLLEQAAEPLEEQTQTALYRHLHTIKGNARTLGLLAVTDSLHAAEQILQEGREHQQAILPSDLQQSIQRVIEDLAQYSRIYNERLRSFGQKHAAVAVSSELWQQVQQLAADREDSQLLHLLKQADNCNLGELFSSLRTDLNRLARELGKPEPRLAVPPSLSNCYLHTAHARCLNDALVHILRNCLDHGIESVEQRLAAGKPEAGVIQIEEGLDNGLLRLQIGDDGRGLALAQLQAKAIDNGWLAAEASASDEQIAEMIFHSGLSTADQVTMISGRGVGMDAVRNSLAELGGSISVTWIGGRNNVGYRPFKLTLELPYPSDAESV